MKPFSIVALLAAFVCLVGCSSGKPNVEKKSSTPAPAATLRVELSGKTLIDGGPATTDLGTILAEVFVGAMRTDTYSVSNSGASPVTFGPAQVVFDGSGDAFRLGTFAATTLNPGAKLDLPIIYAPQSDGPHPTTVRLAGAFSFAVTGRTRRSGRLALAGPAGPLAWRESPAASLANGTDRGSWPVSATADSCLLYTSDAADDM
jgi:hypothetical protein